MSDAADALRHHVLAWLEPLEDIAKRATKPGPELEALAARMCGEAERDFILRHTDPVLLRRTFRDIRTLIQAGELDRAAAKMRRFETARQHIAALLIEPDAARGRKVIEGSQLGGRMQNLCPAAREKFNREVNEEFAALTAEGTKITAAEALIAERRGLHARTIRRALGKK